MNNPIEVTISLIIIGIIVVITFLREKDNRNNLGKKINEDSFQRYAKF